MDLTRPVSYRGFFLNGVQGGPGGNNPLDGRRLIRASYTAVPAIGYTEKKSLEDGLDASDVWLGGRDVVLQGEVFAHSKSALFDDLDLLRLKFTATDCYAEDPEGKGYLPLLFEQPTEHLAHWPSGFSERQILVRPSRQPEHDIEFQAIGGIATNGFVCPYVARLQARDPRFYHPFPVESFLSGDVGSGAVANRGNYPTPANFFLRPADGQSWAGTFTFNGMGTSMLVTIPAGGSGRIVRVDSHQKVCTLIVGSVETLRMDLIVFNSGTTWPKVPPTPEGSSVGFEWSLPGFTLVSPSRMFFSEAWV